MSGNKKFIPCPPPVPKPSEVWVPLSFNQDIHSTFGGVMTSYPVDQIDNWIKITFENEKINPYPKDTVAANMYKKKGDDQMRKKMYDDAITFYKKAFDSDERCVNMRCNRSLAYLKVGMYWNALQDAAYSVRKEPQNFKALYRLASACIGLKMYSKAVEELGNGIPKLILGPEDANRKCLADLLEESKLLVKQSTTGEGYEDLILGKTARAAEFVGKVEVVVECQGRGQSQKQVGRPFLVTTEEVKPGELLLVSNAWAITEWEKLDARDIQEKMWNYHALAEKLCKYLFRIQRLKRVFNHLWAGPDLGYLDPEKSGSASDELPETRFNAVILHNKFLVLDTVAKYPECHSFYPGGRGNVQFKDRMRFRYGFWQMPSYIKHSCSEGNAMWVVYGETMFVRAVKPMKAGEAILMNRLPPIATYDQRVQHFTMWKWKCSCQLCVFEGLSVSNGKDVKIPDLLVKMGNQERRTCAQVMKLFTDLEDVIFQSAAGQPKLDIPIPILLEAVAVVISKAKQNPLDSDSFKTIVNVLLKAYKMTLGTHLTAHAIHYSCELSSLVLKHTAERDQQFPELDKNFLMKMFEDAHELAYGTRCPLQGSE